MKPVLSLFCAALLCPALMAAAPKTKTGSHQRTLTVDGKASVQIPVTEAHLVIAIEAQKKTAEAAQAVIAEKSSALLRYLRESKVLHLQTPGLTLQPLYESSKSSVYRSNENRPITGYRARWVASFDIPIAKAGKLADSVVRHGANRIVSFQPKASDEAVMKAHREALGEAARNARADADAVLGALGYKRLQIIRIGMGSNDVNFMFRTTMAGASLPQAASTAMAGGTESVQGRVSLTVTY